MIIVIIMMKCHSCHTLQTTAVLQTADHQDASKCSVITLSYKLIKYKVIGLGYGLQLLYHLLYPKILLTFMQGPLS